MCTYKWTHIFINKSQIILKFSADIDDIHDMIFHKFQFSLNFNFQNAKSKFKYIVKSKFTVFYRTRIYREREERFQDNCIIERASHGGSSVIVWAGVFLHHKTNIVFIKGNLTAARYKHEVLDTEVIPPLRNHREMQLLHDPAPAHLARATTAYLNANDVNVVKFPPKITRLI